MKRAPRAVAALVVDFVAGVLPILAAAPGPGRPVRPTGTIPRVDKAPRLEDFLEMKQGPTMERRNLRVTGFTQTLARDGEPVTQPTDAYFGYDRESLYVVIVAFDAEPELIRARMTPRERFSGNDKSDVFLDTFRDERRAYGLVCNARGVQMDGRWTEGSNFDSSFKPFWHSRGRLTKQGYVIWMSSPFKSLRFPAVRKQEWGLVLIRWFPRNNEQATSP